MKNTSIYRVFALVLVLLQTMISPNFSTAQERRFRAGILLGANYAALEYNQLGAYYGLNTGLIGQARINHRLSVAVEMLYSLNGEYIAPKSYPQTEYGKVFLHHLEIPVHADWLLKKWKKPWTYKWDISMGIAYAVLMGYYVEDFLQNDLTEQIIYHDKFSILIQGGTTYYFHKHVGINLRASIPVTEKGLEWTLAARLLYLI